jgi:hypothetical protein
MRWLMGRGLTILAVAAAMLVLGGCATAPGTTASSTGASAAVTAQPNVPRVKLYETTPNLVAGRDTEVNPMEPTLDLYLPPADKATGAGVLVLPGGGVFDAGAVERRIFAGKVLLGTQHRGVCASLPARAAVSLSDDPGGRAAGAAADSFAGAGISRGFLEGGRDGFLGRGASGRDGGDSL